MKLIRNNFCVVAANDILQEPIPKFKEGMPDCLSRGDYVTFRSEEAINYFKGREDILDYDEVSCLSEEDLDRAIKRINTYEKLYNLALRCLTSGLRERLNKNEKYQKRCKILKAKHDSLTDYKENKEKIDATFQQMESIILENQTHKLRKTNE